jgi:hypothetical protein
MRCVKSRQWRCTNILTSWQQIVPSSDSLHKDFTLAEIQLKWKQCNNTKISKKLKTKNTAKEIIEYRKEQERNVPRIAEDMYVY